MQQQQRSAAAVGHNQAAARVPCWDSSPREAAGSHDFWYSTSTLCTILQYLLRTPVAQRCQHGQGRNTLAPRQGGQAVQSDFQRARTKYDAEVRGLPTTARPTKEQIELTVRDEFPDEPQAGADAILTPEQLDWRSGEVDYGKRADGGDRAAPVCIHFVWRAPCTQTRW